MAVTHSAHAEVMAQARSAAPVRKPPFGVLYAAPRLAAHRSLHGGARLEIVLAYGESGLVVDVDERRTTVLEPVHVPGFADEREAIGAALRNPVDSLPLSRLVGPRQTVAIAVCDVTRPMPSATVLPAVLEALAHVPPERVTIVVATGTHRANTTEELERMLGRDTVRDYRVVNHDAFDEYGLAYAGEIGGIPVWLNRIWSESEVRITTGFVEPHFFAGFSGGPKMVAPGLAGAQTIMRLHSAALISHPRATWGVTAGNPVHDAIRAITRHTGITFNVDVTINAAREVTGVFAGELFATHAAACAAVRASALRAVDAPFDVVLTSNSGFPLDLNLYQAVKGMSAAAQIVRDAGTIICAAECRDGIPDHGEFREILSSRATPDELLEMISASGYSHLDQWEVQILAQIRRRARVLLKSTFLAPEEVRAAHLEPVEDLAVAVAEALTASGPAGSLCVIPQGPQTIPYVA